MAKEENIYYKLVDDLSSNKLPLSVVCTAIKESIRRDKNLPEGVKNIVAPYGDVGSGVIDKCFRIIKQSIGETELAYRRGIQAGEEREN